MEISPKIIKSNLKFFTGKFTQTYPLYASKTIKKVRLGIKVKQERRLVEVQSLKFLKLKKVTPKKLLQNIQKRIKKVSGDFRQEEILKIWNERLQNYQGLTLVIASFKIKCSSGFYVRTLANTFGEKIGIPALAFSIKRTKIGVWELLKNNIKN
jgi:tRNA U55 pseudouridine synthase TruB